MIKSLTPIFALTLLAITSHSGVASAGDAPVAASTAVRVAAPAVVKSALGYAAGGSLSAIGAAATVTFSPSTIGCGRGETCR